MISSKDNELKHDYYSFVERGVREISTGITALSNSLRLSLDEMDESSSTQLMYGRGRLHVRFSRSFFPILITGERDVYARESTFFERQERERERERPFKRIWEWSENQDFLLRGRFGFFRPFFPSEKMFRPCRQPSRATQKRTQKMDAKRPRKLMRNILSDGKNGREKRTCNRPLTL